MRSRASSVVSRTSGRMPSVRSRRGRSLGSNDMFRHGNADGKGVSLCGQGASVGSGDVELVFERGEFLGVVDDFEPFAEVVGTKADFHTTLFGRKGGLLLAVVTAH